MGRRGLAALVAVAVVAAVVLLLSCGGGRDSAPGQVTRATLPATTPPMLLVVSDGAADALVLYWTGGPENATTWQYRTRGPWYSDRAAWGEWTDIPASSPATRSYRLTGLGEGLWYGIQARGVVGTLAGAPSDLVEGEVPTLDANGVPRMGANWGTRGQLSEGGRAWRLGATVVDIPAGMRVHRGVPFAPSDPPPPYDAYLVDAESDSVLYMDTGHGAECSRDVRTAAAGRDINALFDQIIASARVQLDAEPWLSVTAPGDRGVVTLRWGGGSDDATRWEYRLRGPYPAGGPWPELPWGGWTEVPGSDGETASHSVGGLPAGTEWGFQVRAVADGAVGVPSHEMRGVPAVVGADGIPQLGYSWLGEFGRTRSLLGEGGRTWRLHDSATIIDVPVGLVVSASPPGHYSDPGHVSVTEQSTSDWVLVDVAAAAEVEFSRGIVPNAPCQVRPAGHAQLFDRMRASLRLQPIAR